MADGAPGACLVQTAPSAKDGIAAIPGRLVALRRDATAAARPKGKLPAAPTLAAADDRFLCTTVPARASTTRPAAASLTPPALPIACSSFSRDPSPS